MDCSVAQITVSLDLNQKDFLNVNNSTVPVFKDVFSEFLHRCNCMFQPMSLFKSLVLKI